MQKNMILVIWHEHGKIPSFPLSDVNTHTISYPNNILAKIGQIPCKVPLFEFRIFILFYSFKKKSLIIFPFYTSTHGLWTIKNPNSLFS